MTRDEAVALIARRLGNRTDLDSSIVSEMQLAQMELEEDSELRPWWLLSEMASTTTADEEMRILLPDDFLAEYENGALWLYTATADSDKRWTGLDKKFLDDAIQTYDDEPGEPEVYARAGNYFRVFPLPDDEYTVKMLYYKKGTELTTDITNVWLTHAADLLMGKTGMAMAGYIGNKMSFGLFEAMMVRGRERLIKSIVSDEMKGMELTMGGAG